jgi:chemotaxis protein CheD
MDTQERFFLQPGYIFASKYPYQIHTVLGSCVSVCVWESEKKAGGMNHFIYGRSQQGFYNARYGDVSTMHLIHMMLEMGCQKTYMKAHVIGGGYNPELGSKIGNENARIAEEILMKNRIEIATKDTGGMFGRKLIFNNVTGEILVYKGANIRREDWYEGYAE